MTIHKQYVKALALMLVALFAALPPLARAEAPEKAPEARIMLVGDSWAWFAWLNRSVQQALRDAGFGQYEEVGLYTTVPGSTVAQWTDPEWLANVARELDNHPTVDMILLSLCGNDFLNAWSPAMSAEEVDALFQGIVDNLEVVLNGLLEMRPNLRVAIAGYDYVNTGRRGSTWQELNQAGVVLAKMKRDLAARMGRVAYVQLYGVMQYHFGHEPDFPPKSVALPGQNPNYTPFPGGNPEFGNPSEAMFDAIHLSPEGYYRYAEHVVDTVFADWLENPLTTQLADAEQGGKQAASVN